MILRILIVAACSLGVGSSSLAAQRVSLRPRPSSLFIPPATTSDTAHLAPTYWKEGALLTGVPVGIAGYLLAAGLCDQDDSYGGGQHCGLKGLGGLAAGFLIGAIPGALIGGQIHKKE